MKTRICLLIAAVCSLALAHKPFFPEGKSPYQVTDPSTSQAHYLNLGANETHVFLVPPLTRSEPVEVLVLDNDLGRSLEIEAYWICGNEQLKLAKVDQYFFEEFSRIEHRYKAIELVGPTKQACEVHISEANGKAAPYTFAIGVEENFTLLDVLSFFTLGDRLAAWQRGEAN